MDTTSLSFCGAGGDRLGAQGHSKDLRPDLKQMILAVVIDSEGRPICTKMLPGNTADTTVLLPVVMTRSLCPPSSSLCKQYELIFVIDTTWRPVRSIVAATRSCRRLSSGFTPITLRDSRLAAYPGAAAPVTASN
jgi:hypothetical protein